MKNPVRFHRPLVQNRRWTTEVQIRWTAIRKVSRFFWYFFLPMRLEKHGESMVKFRVFFCWKKGRFCKVYGSLVEELIVKFPCCWTSFETITDLILFIFLLVNVVIDSLIRYLFKFYCKINMLWYIFMYKSLSSSEKK